MKKSRIIFNSLQKKSEIRHTFKIHEILEASWNSFKMKSQKLQNQSS